MQLNSTAGKARWKGKEAHMIAFASRGRRKFISGAALFVLSGCGNSATRVAEPASTPQEVEQIFQIFRQLYTPILQKMGYSLEFSHDTRSRDVQAYTLVQGRRVFVRVFGGLSRILNADELAFVLCHEVGHNVGGKPWHGDQDGQIMASSEGQADYHAARSCIRRYLAQGPAIAVPVPTPFIQQRCSQGFGSDPVENAYCIRALTATAFLGKIVSANGGDARLSFETPDRSVVTRTIVGRPGDLASSYPSDQCRIDTYLAGYFREERPRCWYNPADNAGYEEVFSDLVPAPGQPPATPGRPPAAPVPGDLRGHRYEQEIAAAIQNGLIRGYGDGTFRADAAITRLELSLLAQQFLRFATGGRIAPAGQVAAPPFPDVPVSHPFVASIDFARQHQILAPFADGLFRPEQAVPRDYFTAALHRAVQIALATQQKPALESLAQPAGAFADLQGHWAENYVRPLAGFCASAFSENGGAFEAGRSTTRGYAAVAAYRAFECLRRL